MAGKRAEAHDQGNSAIVGGYMMHSSRSRCATGKLAFGQQVFIVLIVAVLAVHTDHFSALTAALFGFCLALVPAVWLIRWESLSPTWFILYLWVSAGVYVVMAFDFRESDALLGLFTPAMLLAGTFWYRRRIAALNLCAMFGIFSVASLTIAGRGELATVLISAPMMALTATRIGRTSYRYLDMLLSSQRFRATVRTLLHALHARDGYTGEHSQITVRMADGVGERLGLDEDTRAELADVALLHDLGKIGIPNAILHKPGALDQREWEIMRRHPEIGEQILADVPGFKSISRAVRHEHERWDGNGYPDGLSGDDIPLASRIVLVCDAYHAMTSDRPYRAAMSDADARAEMIQNAGTQFDPCVVTALLQAIDDGVMLDSAMDPDAVDPNDAVAPPFEAAHGDRALIGAEAEARPARDSTSFMPDRRTAERDGERVDVSNDRELMMDTIVASSLLGAALLCMYMVAFASVDIFGIAVAAGAIAGAVLCKLVLKVDNAKVWYGVAVVVSYVATPVVAAYYGEPAMLLFLLTLTTSAAGFFWRTKSIRAVQIAAATFVFGVLPIVLFGFDELARALIGTRAFLGVILVVGFLANKMSELEFERERFASTESSLLIALHARDGYTAAHSTKTVELAVGVAERLGLDQAQRDELATIAILHDIGKIGVPDEILHKPGKLDDVEWEIMRQHPVIGEQIVAQVPGFDAVARAIRHEHERWDGGGYPDGLKGWQIPIASRIVLVCDAYHAMTSDRPYRKTMGEVEARTELLTNAGTQFDPQVVTALIEVLDDDVAVPAISNQRAIDIAEHAA